ncbi:MAG: lamin tail domain-containing protein [Ardenticatenia bacterium]|nr:lamin tail domain-containing protein [Ardenticatenia bacterium]
MERRFWTWRWWILVLVVGMVVSRVGAQPANLLTNPGFESDLSGWSFSPSTAQVTLVPTAYGGAQAAALAKSNASGWVRLWQRVPVTPNVAYQLTGWVLWNDNALSNARLQVRWHGTAGPLGGYVAVDAPARSPQYQRLVLGPLTAPPDAVEAEVTCYTFVNTPSPAQPLLCDELWFGRVSSLPSPTLTLTPSVTPMVTVFPTVTPTPTVLPSPTRSPLPTLTPTGAPTATPTPTPQPTVTSTPTPTATATVMPSPTPVPTPWSGRAVLISEVAWAGTRASPNDEWVELYNPNSFPVTLDGWGLRAQDGTPVISLSGTIAPNAFFLLERTDDSTVADVSADLLYTGSLENEGEVLELVDPSGTVVDRADGGGGWPAGDAAVRATMERVSLDPERPATWATNDGLHINGVDAAGNPIVGTPRAPNSTSYPTPTSVPTPSPTPTATPSPLPPTATREPTPSITPTATALPLGVVINEVLSVPRNVDWDGDGTPSAADEWVELYNGSGTPVDLGGWQLDDAPGGSRPYTLPANTVVPPGGFMLLFQAETGLRLNNDGDQVRLLGPHGQVLDAVTLPALAPDASFSRDERGAWHADWPPSPGAPNRPPPTPTATASPTVTPTPRTTPTPALPERLVISEVLYDGTQPGDGDEFVEIYNPGTIPVRLSGWGVGDAQVAGVAEGLYRFPADWVLGPGSTLVIARDAAAFRARFGVWPDAELEPEEDTPDVPTLPRDPSWGRGRWALNNSGDEVVLVDWFNRIVDALAYRHGDFVAIGRTGHDVTAPAPRSLHRLPESRSLHLNDLLVYAPPSPGRPLQGPRAFPPPPPAPAFGPFRAYWGTLHAHSTYSDGSGPPPLAYAVARANGLHFMALSDHSHWFTAEEWQRTGDAARAATVPETFVALRAFEWTGKEEGHINVFVADEVLSREAPEGDTLADFYAWLATQPQALAQFNHPFEGHLTDFEAAPPNVRPQMALLEVANGGGTPLRFADAYWRALWQGWRVGAAGNLDTQTPDWGADGELRTGLLARALTPDALIEAIASRRAFSTEDASLALVLRAGEVWMGGAIDPGAVRFTLMVADREREPLELALWRNGAPIFRDRLVPDAEPVAREVEVPARPGDIFVAQAVQADGQVAWSSPIWVRGTWSPPPVRVNEVLPAPRQVDWNGDGVLSSEDEWVELYNPLDEPVSLAGWLLDDGDGGSRPYRLPTGTLIPPRGYLVLHRSRTGVALNDAGDEVRLFARDGTLVDRVAFGRLPVDQSLSNDGAGGFQADWAVTPGAPNMPRLRPTPSPRGDGESSIPPAAPVEGPRRLPPADVRRQPVGTRVITWGVVSVPPGVLGKRVFYVQDGEAGLKIYVRRGELPDVAPGDRVELTGVVGQYRGELEVRINGHEDVRLLERGPAPRPLAVEQLSAHVAARLVSVTGTVVEWQRASWTLRTGTGAEVEIFLRRTTGLRRPWLEQGELQTVVGIVGYWDGRWQLWPALPEHLTGGAVLLLPETGSDREGE